MVGYCSTGIERIDNPPTSITRMAMTIAKIGRSIKNFAMAGVLTYFALERTAAGDAFGASAAAARGAAIGGDGAAAAVVVCGPPPLPPLSRFSLFPPPAQTRSPLLGAPPRIPLLSPL